MHSFYNAYRHNIISFCHPEKWTSSNTIHEISRRFLSMIIFTFYNAQQHNIIHMIMGRISFVAVHKYISHSPMVCLELLT